MIELNSSLVIVRSGGYPYYSSDSLISMLFLFIDLLISESLLGLSSLTNKSSG